MITDLSALDAQAWREIVLVALTWAALAVAARCLYVMLRNSWQDRAESSFVAQLTTDFLPVSDGVVRDITEVYDFEPGPQLSLTEKLEQARAKFGVSV